MASLLHFVLLTATVGIIAIASQLSSVSPAAVPVDQNSEVADDMSDFIYGLQRRSWCARWGDFCVPNAKVKFADCCEGLRCVCGGLLWKSKQCKCKKPSVFG